MKSLYPSSFKAKSSKYPGPVLGSDFPVEPPNPFHGMYAAVTRLNPTTGTSPSGESGWYPEESLSVEEALLGFTRNGAYGWFKEDKTGAIEVGKWADWVVIDRNILSSQPRESLRNVAVKETWMGGRRVYPQVAVVMKSEGWLTKVTETVQAPPPTLRELLIAIKELIEAIARLVEAMASLLRALNEFLGRKASYFVQWMGGAANEL
jgi:hypothetical protein